MLNKYPNLVVESGRLQYLVPFQTLTTDICVFTMTAKDFEQALSGQR